MATYTTTYSGCTYGVRADFSIADEEVEHLDADGEWLSTGKLARDFAHDWRNALKAELSADDPVHPDDMELMESAIRHALSDDKAIIKVQESIHIGVYSICNRFVAIAMDNETFGYGYYQLADGDVVDMYDKTVCEQLDAVLFVEERTFLATARKLEQRMLYILKITSSAMVMRPLNPFLKK